MSTYDDPGEINSRMANDYGEIAKIIDDRASRMSDSDVRKSAETLAESYATISASLQDQENASDQPVQEQLDRGAEMLGALATATTEYRNQCPSNP